MIIIAAIKDLLTISLVSPVVSRMLLVPESRPSMGGTKREADTTDVSDGWPDEVTYVPFTICSSLSTFSNLIWSPLIPCFLRYAPYRRPKASGALR